MWHGILIAVMTLGAFDTAHESHDNVEEDTQQLSKNIGMKDGSTVAFNITLTVIFLKLSFELDKMSKAAIFVIVATLILSYILVAVFGNSGLARALDPDLIGIGVRSVFSIEGFFLLAGSCLIITFLEYLFMYLRMLKRICRGEGRQE